MFRRTVQRSTRRMVASSISLKLASLYFGHFLFFASDLFLSHALLRSRLSFFFDHVRGPSPRLNPLSTTIARLIPDAFPLHPPPLPTSRPTGQPTSQPSKHQPPQTQPSTSQPDYTRGGNFTSPIHLCSVPFKCRRRDLSRDPIWAHVPTNAYAIVRLLHGYRTCSRMRVK